MAEQVDQFLTGTEFWQLGAKPLHCHVEALPLKIGKRRCVVSLCHNLG
ncbi:MAG: hypothetical protein HC771_05260 [Synechococcales cyanobacterium CRU_2_2]|nr:hypothetical protein [Synechococcales cyanobacterium CRU_2_2]